MRRQALVRAVFYSRAFWVIIGSILAVVILLVALVTVPAGPTPFSLKTISSSCACQTSVALNQSFPARASVQFTWWAIWSGQAAELEMIVYAPDGTALFEAPAENSGVVPPGMFAGGGPGFFSSTGGGFTFDLHAIPPSYLPPATVWVNGTYTAPIL